MKKILLILLVVLTAPGCRKKETPLNLPELPATEESRRLTKETITTYKSTGEIFDINEAIYLFNMTGQLIKMSEVYINSQLKMNDTIYHQVIFENGRVSQLRSTLGADSWSTEFYYDDKGRHHLMIRISAKGPDTTFFSYNEPITMMRNQTPKEITEHYIGIDLDSTYKYVSGSEVPEIERYFYNKQTDKAYISLRENLSIFYPKHELVKRADKNGEFNYSREYDAEGYPIRRTEMAPSYKKVTEYFY